MENKMINLPAVEKINFRPAEKPGSVNQEASCCTPKGNANQCCSPSRSREDHDGACCAQPEDGSSCCNK